MFAGWWEWVWGGRRDRERTEAPKQSGDGGGKPPEPEPQYAPDYPVLITQGHTRTTPSIRASTLGWHIGIWPRTKTRPGGGGKSEECDPQDTRCLQHGDAQLAYAARRHAWIEQINAFIAELQCKGRGRRDGFRLSSVKKFDPECDPARSDEGGSAVTSP